MGPKKVKVDPAGIQLYSFDENLKLGARTVSAWVGRTDNLLSTMRRGTFVVTGKII